MDFEGLSIERLNHDCFKVKEEKTIYFDPYKLPDGALEPADMIFISHDHYDHCSHEDVKRIIGPKTVIVSISACKEKLSSISSLFKFHTIRPGDEFSLSDIHIRAVPAYNLDKPFHPKEKSYVGFVVTIAGKRIYHAGDTDLIPEMYSLGEVDIALLPVSGTYVMTSKEASKAAKVIKPRLAIPMHYGAGIGTIADAEQFKKLVSKSCRVELI